MWNREGNFNLFLLLALRLWLCCTDHSQQRDSWKFPDCQPGLWLRCNTWHFDCRTGIRYVWLWAGWVSLVSIVVQAYFSCVALVWKLVPLGTTWGPKFCPWNTLTTNLSAGGHLNPVVTFAMCLLAREPWIKLPIYALAQTLGAFLGAGIVFGLYYGKCGNLVAFLRWHYRVCDSL